MSVIDVTPDALDAVFARRVCEARRAAGLKQQDLADLMSSTGRKMHRSQIGKIEAGDRVVSVGEAVQLAAFLEVDLAELVSGWCTPRR
jgi:ribosome-binding protein aMBF1 (putative translation factor)